MVDPGTDRSLISGNQISEATGVGILVLSANADIDQNTISDTAYNPDDGFGDAIAFSAGANVTITGNSCDDNDRNGIIFLDGATGSISGNTATGNTQYGILEICTGDPNDVDVGPNELTGNGIGDQSLCS